MHCVLCLMSRLSIQEIKARHASMVQMLSYVETVDTLRSKHTEQCIVCCVSCRDCRYKMHKHVHMFLPITFLNSTDFQSEKSFGMLRIRAFQPYHQILYMSILSIQVVIFQCNSVLVMSTRSTLSKYRI